MADYPIRRWSCAVPLNLLLIGCIACSKPAPSIEIDQFPIAGSGGPSRMDPISGWVRGKRGGQQLVLFAKAGVWWIQPYANRPFTAIGADGRWSTTTHLGSDYAVLLVDAGYRPSYVLNTLPATGSGIAAIATVKGRDLGTTRKEQFVSFSGYKWQVRDGETDRNGSQHAFNPGNVAVDGHGFLHMSIAGTPKHWTCSEVFLTRSLGYGTYAFSVQDTSRLAPAAVLSLFTWTDGDADQNHREMDINITRWGDPASKGAEFVLQPYYLSPNIFRLVPPAGRVEYSMRWQPGLVSFRGHLQHEAAGSSFAEHNFSVGVPSSGDETLHLNLCPFEYAKVPLQQSAEVVVEHFQFLP